MGLPKNQRNTGCSVDRFQKTGVLCGCVAVVSAGLVASLGLVGCTVASNSSLDVGEAKNGDVARTACEPLAKAMANKAVSALGDTALTEVSPTLSLGGFGRSDEEVPVPMQVFRRQVEGETVGVDFLSTVENGTDLDSVAVRFVLGGGDTHVDRVNRGQWAVLSFKQGLATSEMNRLSVCSSWTEGVVTLDKNSAADRYAGALLKPLDGLNAQAVLDLRYLDYTLQQPNNALAGLEDIRFVAGLVSLETFGICTSECDLYENTWAILDASPLSGLHGMQQLFLDNNYITDLSFVQNMPQLVRLSIENTEVNDLSPLCGNVHPRVSVYITRTPIAYNAGDHLLLDRKQVEAFYGCFPGGYLGRTSYKITVPHN